VAAFLPVVIGIRSVEHQSLLLLRFDLAGPVAGIWLTQQSRIAKAGLRYD
jgi:hypothetical protein